jgi:dolichol kinase
VQLIFAPKRIQIYKIEAIFREFIKNLKKHVSIFQELDPDNESPHYNKLWLMRTLVILMILNFKPYLKFGKGSFN